MSVASVNYIVLSELKILNEYQSVIPIAFVQERTPHTWISTFHQKSTLEYLSYGITMEQESWVSISFPYQVTSQPG